MAAILIFLFLEISQDQSLPRCPNLLLVEYAPEGQLIGMAFLRTSEQE